VSLASFRLVTDQQLSVRKKGLSQARQHRKSAMDKVWQDPSHMLFLFVMVT
jgi:hypothetical protein